MPIRTTPGSRWLRPTSWPSFAGWLATQAHQRALSVGLKNDLDKVAELTGTFDWALDEQCYEYNECHLLQPFIDAGKAVFGVEYDGDESVFCPTFNALTYSWLKKELDLGAWRIDCRDIPRGRPRGSPRPLDWCRGDLGGCPPKSARHVGLARKFLQAQFWPG